MCASSCRNISKAKNKEGGVGGCNQYTTTKNKISEDTGFEGEGFGVNLDTI